MFCSRMSSGSSAAETIQPKTERKARFIRCHMNGILAVDCAGKRETVSTVSHGWQGRARSRSGLFGARLRASFRRISRLGSDFRAQGRPRAGDRARARTLRPRSCRGESLRSEEHTSELQSRVDLVCRLLLEKKKKKIKKIKNNKQEIKIYRA